MNTIQALFREKRFGIVSEGIQHIEDLHIDKFLKTIKNLYDFYASEKMDGAELVFGFDENMQFFTSRSQKGRDQERKYTSKAYANVAAYNGFRAAHDALARLFRRNPNLKKWFKPNDQVEMEVIFGSQPNVITYSKDGKNFLVMLRDLEQTMGDNFEKFCGEVDKTRLHSTTKMLDSVDGISIEEQVKTEDWIVVANKRVKISSSIIDQTKINQLVAKLEFFLRSKNTKVSGILGRTVTNFEVLTARSLHKSGISPTEKNEIKSEKDSVNQSVLTDFKLPIKHELFDELLERGRLSVKEMDGIVEGPLGIEGFVLSDGKDQIKIVDRDLFTAINEFNYKIRNELTGIIMTNGDDSSLENRGGVLGVCKTRIAELFDLPELAKTSKAKDIFMSYRGNTVFETLDNFAKSLRITDVNMFRTKVEAIIKDTIEDLQHRLDLFKRESDSYEITLKNGEKIKMTEEAKRRTLVAFAEIQSELGEILTKLKKVTTTPELLLAIYGRIIEEVQNSEAEEDEEVVTESLKTIRALLNEDGEGGIATGTTSTAMGDSTALQGSTRAGDIAPYPKRLFGGKVIRRVVRTFKKKKTKNTDWVKVK